MSKPMTEARLAEIETDTKNYGICCMDCSVETILELTAEVRRLRECIAKAPHANGCDSYESFDGKGGIVSGPCDCWQREALGGGE